ncbi:hypothetical protein BDBG_17118, partial [Blastomyces gilchristii SLH14081]
SSHVDRSASADNSELNIKSLIENLKNVIMKKLFMLYMTESSMSLSTLSVSFSITLFSQSSTPVSVSDSFTSATSILTTSTPATSALTAVFVTSSSHFKKMLHRL